MYIDHQENWLDLGQDLLISSFSWYFQISKTGHILDFQACSGEHSTAELIRSWSRPVDLFVFYDVSKSVKQVKCVCIRLWSGEQIWGMAWKWVCSYFLPTFYSIDFSHFSDILTKWSRSTLRSSGIFWRMHGRNILISGMLIYSNHLQKWLDFGKHLLIFVILSSLLRLAMPIWLSLYMLFFFKSIMGMCRFYELFYCFRPG